MNPRAPAQILGLWGQGEEETRLPSSQPRRAQTCYFQSKPRPWRSRQAESCHLCRVKQGRSLCDGDVAAAAASLLEAGPARGGACDGAAALALQMQHPSSGRAGHRNEDGRQSWHIAWGSPRLHAPTWQPQGRPGRATSRVASSQVFIWKQECVAAFGTQGLALPHGPTIPNRDIPSMSNGLLERLAWV